MKSGGATFLVAEDDARVGRLLARTLSRHGCAHVVTTYKEARDALDEGSYTALVADVGLPDGSGLDLVAAAKARDPSLPALILSGEVDADRLSGAYALGVHYLLKPVNSSELEMFAARATGRSVANRTRVESVLKQWVREYSLTWSEAQVLRLA